MYTHTRNGGIRTRLHTCMHRYARSGFMYTHSCQVSHTHAHKDTHTHTHTQVLRPTKRQVCTSAAGRCYPRSPSNNNWFHLIKTQENESYKQQGESSSERPHWFCFDAVSFFLASNVSKVWHNTTSPSVSPSLLHRAARPFARQERASFFFNPKGKERPRVGEKEKRKEKKRKSFTVTERVCFGIFCCRQ